MFYFEFSKDETLKLICKFKDFINIVLKHILNKIPIIYISLEIYIL